MTHWAAPLIGKPYKSGATGPDEFDCIGLVRYYFKQQFNIELPDYQLVEGTPRELWAFVKATGWHRVTDGAQDRDIMLMENWAGRHVGVVTCTSDGLGLLHAEGNDRSGSVKWQPLSTLTMYRNLEVWRPLCTA
jgi:hypothetical protein